MTKPVVLITGASAGLGVDFARQMSVEGSSLVLVARRKERLEELAAELGNARAVELDLAEPGAAERLMADLAAHGEHVDCLVNNAGFGLSGTVASLDGARQRSMIDLNCSVLTELCHAVLPGMIERGRGGILNVASTAAFQPGPYSAVYYATKAYVLSFTEALHVEVQDKGVHVTALCPGPTQTEFFHVAGYGEGNMLEKMAMPSAPVVAAGLAGLARNQAVVIPGAFNKVGAQGHRFLPRSVLRKIAAMIKAN
jgi:short-subunit dehydrogenase